MKNIFVIINLISLIGLVVGVVVRLGEGDW